MKTLIFQHTPEEAPGTLAEWLTLRRYPFTVHHAYLGAPPPPATAFTALVILGGPMNVDEEAAHPWLRAEKQFLQVWLREKKPVLGICLGGQMLAQALGGRVERSREREIGFCGISRTAASAAHPVFQSWPEKIRVYQYHEDRFTLPPGCQSLLTSPACEHQAFALNDHTIGLQFHPESTAEWIRLNYLSIVAQSGEHFVQSPEDTEAELPRALEPMKNAFFCFLDTWKKANSCAARSP